jgi:YbbR domain-containing protein
MSQVTVTGPSSAVDRVSEIVLPVVIDATNESYSTSITPLAVDSAGQPVTEVEILPNTVLVEVEVQRQGKSVSVIPNVTGAPADGYAVQQRRALPDTIVVDGPEELLADLLFVNTEPVDVSGASNSISTMVGIADLPQGVTIIEPSGGEVEVRVAIEDATTSSQPVTDLPVEIRGLEIGTVGTVTPETISIDVSAPTETLQQMTPGDITVSVDATGLEPGIYILNPDVSLPPGATWRASTSDDTRIRVVIERESDTGTPVNPTAVATPTD